MFARTHTHADGVIALSPSSFLCSLHLASGHFITWPSLPIALLYLLTHWTFELLSYRNSNCQGDTCVIGRAWLAWFQTETERKLCFRNWSLRHSWNHVLGNSDRGRRGFHDRQKVSHCAFCICCFFSRSFLV